MRIGGYQKLTLIDYPGKLASTVFTVGCSFRCPFCHNPELVFPNPSPALPLERGGRKSSRLSPLPRGRSEEGVLEKEFFDFLKKRKGKIEGVCITGGEPTIQPDIIDFIKKIKKAGFFVKLDTNGTRPDVLKKILDLKLLDFIAMDIKNQLKKYEKTVGMKKVDKDRIRLSVDLIRNSRVPYEFRTTVVPGLHSEKDFLEIGRWLSGADRYFLQEYREGRILDPKLKKKTKGRKIDLEKIKKSVEKYFGKVGVRSS
ncbi:MAG: anaerobic ribonucleoside-triphosphate reductase activating protein [Candidatus Moranbacteria bacterium]|nr:anaerobic ribonucleoside-triphosphate reductase activating protein [Candidatus Moranbacteria bacterium]